ncbi:MAG: hypothetical protein ABSD87_14935 [Candidatus Acidiferrales bacterium]
MGKYEKILAVLFLLSLPLINPWVRGDGVGYYAFARAILLEHRLDFEPDWQNANASFRLGRIDPEGHIRPTEYTSTGHLDNHFSIGPAILWSPFLLAAEAVVKFDHVFGGHLAENGFSFPYVAAMALGTAFYSFLGLFLSFRLARKYLGERWAFLGTIGIWFASSLPVYMYFNPSWSHAHSAFVVALFFWYWDRTRGGRTWTQWLVLGAISGLMLDVYYVNGVLLIVPLIESLQDYWRGIRERRMDDAGKLFLQNLLFSLTICVVFLPTLISKRIIYGHYLDFGYHEPWSFASPALLHVAFASEHGLFSWTPIVLLSVIGLVLLHRRDRMLSLCCVAAFAIYLYAIGCYNDWAGISSFGSRFFVSLTPLFILGLAAFFDSLASVITERRANIVATATVSVLILWNAGMIFQWGTHLIPARGPISWRDAAYNQVAVVPEQAARTIGSYFMRRKQLMGHIEGQDVEQLKAAPSEDTK